MAEQSKLLEGMLAPAAISVKELSEKAATLETRHNMVGLEAAILEGVRRWGDIWLGMVLSHWAETLAGEAGTRLPCRCGGMARWVERRAKRVLTLLGRMTCWRVDDHGARWGAGRGRGRSALGAAPDADKSGREASPGLPQWHERRVCGGGAERLADAALAGGVAQG
jgi:hypothetical protein